MKWLTTKKNKTGGRQCRVFSPQGAGFVTALTGLLVGLNQAGFLPVHTKTAPTPEVSTSAPGTTSGPPDRQGSGEADLFQIKSERVAIWRVRDPSSKRTGMYFRNAGTRTVFVHFDGDCLDAACKSDFSIPPIDFASQAAQDTRIPCAADGHLVFDTLEEFTFRWKLWVRDDVTPAVSCSFG